MEKKTALTQAYLLVTPTDQCLLPFQTWWATNSETSLTVKFNRIRALFYLHNPCVWALTWLFSCRLAMPQTRRWSITVQWLTINLATYFWRLLSRQSRVKASQSGTTWFCSKITSTKLLCLLTKILLGLKSQFQPIKLTTKETCLALNLDLKKMMVRATPLPKQCRTTWRKGLEASVSTTYSLSRLNNKLTATLKPEKL